MKRFISFFLILATVFGIMSVGAFAEDSAADVTVGEGFYLKPIPEESEAFTLVYDVCCNDVNGCDIATVGLYLDYSDNLVLESCESVYPNGVFISSQYIDTKPYLMLWAGGTTALPSEETAIARVVFKVVKTLGRGVTLSLTYDPENLPGGITDTIDPDKVQIMGEQKYNYGDLREQFPLLPAIPTMPPVNITEEGFFLRPISAESDEDTLVYDLYLNDINNCGVSSFGIYLTYSEELMLSSCEAITSQGMFVTSQNIDDKPYLMLWIDGTGSLPAGETAIARLVFDVAGILEYGYELGLEYDSDNLPATVEVNAIDLEKLPIMGNLVFSFSDIVRQFPFFGVTPGDVNGDDKINLGDASLALKYIAKWDVEVNTDAADVNDDDKVNLADVSLLLKYIAKWDVVLK